MQQTMPDNVWREAVRLSVHCREFCLESGFKYKLLIIKCFKILLFFFINLQRSAERKYSCSRSCNGAGWI